MLNFVPAPNMKKKNRDESLPDDDAGQDVSLLYPRVLLTFREFFPVFFLFLLKDV